MPETQPRGASAEVRGSVGELVAEIAHVLGAAGIPEARAEARDLVAVIADRPRFWPSLHRDAPATSAMRAAATRAAAKRRAGAPFAYAVGRAAFRHLTLSVDERVLIPRQETEMLVEIALALAPSSGGTAIDIGTGSGAIALALANEGGFDRVIATDVSLDALAVARENAMRLESVLRAPVELRAGSLLAPVRGVRARLLVSNPPYIAADELRALPATVRDWEPAVALLGGRDGMRHIDAIAREAPDVLERNGVLALEVDARRAALIAALIAADRRWSEVRVLLDLTGRERFVVARRGGE